MKNQTNQNKFQFLSKPGTPKVDVSNELEMVREGIRLGSRQKFSIPKKTKDERKMFKQLAKNHLLENKVMIKYAC